MDVMLAAGAIQFDSTSVSTVPCVPQVIEVSVLYLPVFATDEALV